MEGKRTEGRRRFEMINDLGEVTSYEILKRKAHGELAGGIGHQGSA